MSFQSLGSSLLASVLALASLSPVAASAEEAARPPLDRAALVAAAREIMGSQTYCALVTLDAAGLPEVRTMNPFPPEEDMTVWFATNTRSRKVAAIQANPNVVLYYADHAKASGYVTLAGKATLVKDPQEIQKRKRAYWDQAFPGLENLVLIKVTPERLEVLNYKAGTKTDSVTWRTPSLELGSGASARR
jgi:general stress protein 26